MKNKMKKIVINKCYGGFGLSKDAYEFLQIKWDGFGFAFENDRENPKLVECVEKLKEKANGEWSSLFVVKIPYDVDYTINDYDGMEWVAERHRTW